jgi:hypothetical protein
MHLDMGKTIRAIENITIIKAIIETSSIYISLTKYISRDQTVSFINSKVKIYHKIGLKEISHKELFLNISLDQTLKKI